MPSLSSLLGGHTTIDTPPFLIFHGPDNYNHVTATDPSGRIVAQFIAGKGAVSRFAPDDIPQQEICTFKRSSLSGTTTLVIHGSEIKMKQSWEGMQNGKDIKMPSGDMLKWRPGSAGQEELRDQHDVVLARGRLPHLLSKKPSSLEVFVDGGRDLFLVDVIFCSWVGMMQGLGEEAKEAEGIGEVISSMLGG